MLEEVIIVPGKGRDPYSMVPCQGFKPSGIFGNGYALTYAPRSLIVEPFLYLSEGCVLYSSIMTIKKSHSDQVAENT